MNYNPNIYKDIKDTSKSALSFLQFRDKAIKQKDGELAEIEDRLNLMKQSGIPTESEEKVFSAKEQEVFNLEFDVNSIMKEQAFMDKLMFDVRDMLNIDVVTFGDSQKHLEKIKSDMDSILKDIETKNKHISKLEDSNPLKDRLRLDVISKEDYINKLKELEQKINNKFSNFSNYETKRLGKLNTAQSERDSLSEKIASTETLMDSAYSNFASLHKEVVDEKLLMNSKSDNDIDNIGQMYNIAGGENLNQKKFQESLRALDLKGTEELKKYGDYESYLKDMAFLKDQLVNQNNIINTLEDDKNWLYNRIELKDKEVADKDVEIDELKLKLDSWTSSYSEFENLVDDLANKVGYTEEFVNANGDEIDTENPLGTLIERLDRITEFVESKEYQNKLDDNKTKEQTNVVSPVLIGGLALGTLALTTFLNK